MKRRGNYSTLLVLGVIGALVAAVALVGNGSIKPPQQAHAQQCHYSAMATGSEELGMNILGPTYLHMQETTAFEAAGPYQGRLEITPDQNTALGATENISCDGAGQQLNLTKGSGPLALYAKNCSIHPGVVAFSITMPDECRRNDSPPGISYWGLNMREGNPPSLRGTTQPDQHTPSNGVNTEHGTGNTGGTNQCTPGEAEPQGNADDSMIDVYATGEDGDRVLVVDEAGEPILYDGWWAIWQWESITEAEFKRRRDNRELWALVSTMRATIPADASVTLRKRQYITAEIAAQVGQPDLTGKVVARIFGKYEDGSTRIGLWPATNRHTVSAAEADDIIAKLAAKANQNRVTTNQDNEAPSCTAEPQRPQQQPDQGDGTCGGRSIAAADTPELAGQTTIDRSQFQGIDDFQPWCKERASEWRVANGMRWRKTASGYKDGTDAGIRDENIPLAYPTAEESATWTEDQWAAWNENRQAAGLERVHIYRRTCDRALVTEFQVHKMYGTPRNPKNLGDFHKEEVKWDGYGLYTVNTPVSSGPTALRSAKRRYMHMSLTRLQERGAALTYDNIVTEIIDSYEWAKTEEGTQKARRAARAIQTKDVCSPAGYNPEQTSLSLAGPWLDMGIDFRRFQSSDPFAKLPYWRAIGNTEKAGEPMTIFNFVKHWSLERLAPADQHENSLTGARLRASAWGTFKILWPSNTEPNYWRQKVEELEAEQGHR